jgi:hypothetical protein
MPELKLASLIDNRDKKTTPVVNSFSLAIREKIIITINYKSGSSYSLCDDDVGTTLIMLPIVSNSRDAILL